MILSGSTIRRGPGWWDAWFLALAAHVATASKDPSTQCGAVIVRPDRTIAGVGFNGFPRGIRDDARLHDRETKYGLVIHAEMNALLHLREPARGCMIYTHPIAPCIRCAVHLVQAGIVRVVAPYIHERHRGCDAVFVEAGVEFVMMDQPAEPVPARF